MKKILLVEDEEMIAEMYRMKFEQAGFAIDIAFDGRQGVDKATTADYDLILLDLFMPNMNGFEALAAIRKNDGIKKTKIFILSNLVQNPDIDKGFALGADGFLVKASLTPTQLIETVTMIFDGRPVGIQKTETINIKKEEIEGTPAALETAKKRVLIIEDESMILEMYKLRLEQAGYDVEAAGNGTWGIKLAAEKQFDAILLDMILPTMKGSDAMKRILSEGASRKAKIIILSNSGQDKDVEEAMSLGATSYMIKSLITPTKVIEELQRLLV